jgi:hypothetical protein
MTGVDLRSGGPGVKKNKGNECDGEGREGWEGWDGWEGDGEGDGDGGREERSDVALHLFSKHQLPRTDPPNPTVMHRKRVFKMPARKQTAPKLPPSSAQKRFPCMMPQGKRPMPNSGTDSSSSDSSASASDSDSSDSIQLVEKKNNKKKSDNAADSDVEVLEPENERAVAAPFSPDADVVEVASKPGSLASEETKRHLKYQRRYHLVREPVGDDWTHDERATVSFRFSV